MSRIWTSNFEEPLVFFDTFGYKSTTSSIHNEAIKAREREFEMVIKKEEVSFNKILVFVLRWCKRVLINTLFKSKAANKNEEFLFKVHVKLFISEDFRRSIAHEQCVEVTLLRLRSLHHTNCTNTHFYN